MKILNGIGFEKVSHSLGKIENLQFQCYSVKQNIGASSVLNSLPNSRASLESESPYLQSKAFGFASPFKRFFIIPWTCESEADCADWFAASHSHIERVNHSRSFTDSVLFWSVCKAWRRLTSGEIHTVNFSLWTHFELITAAHVLFCCSSLSVCYGLTENYETISSTRNSSTTILTWEPKKLYK